MNNEKADILEKLYIESPSRAIEADSRFKHVMALALDPGSDYEDGIIRCIASREGDVDSYGYVDRSVLHKVHAKKSGGFEITDELVLKNQDDVINHVGGKEWDFLGLEDPDIWRDEKDGTTHVYFTMAFKSKLRDEMTICLGHAKGNGLDDLSMTGPILMDPGKKISAKELSVAPLNERGFRFNLFESSDVIDGTYYSTVRVAIAKDMEGKWEFGETAFHPKECGIGWIGGHASPGPLLPDSFIDIGKGKRLGFMNGREANDLENGRIRYGMFSVGLFVYDYENGRIDWVSPKPLIRDSQAKTITFASQFVRKDSNTGVLYAHVDDSFVRAYELKADDLKRLLP